MIKVNLHIDEPIINLLKIHIDESMVQNFLFDDHVKGLSKKIAYISPSNPLINFFLTNYLTSAY